MSLFASEFSDQTTENATSSNEGVQISGLFMSCGCKMKQLINSGKSAHLLINGVKKIMF